MEELYYMVWEIEGLATLINQAVFDWFICITQNEHIFKGSSPSLGIVFAKNNASFMDFSQKYYGSKQPIGSLSWLLFPSHLISLRLTNNYMMIKKLYKGCFDAMEKLKQVDLYSWATI